MSASRLDAVFGIFFANNQLPSQPAASQPPSQPVSQPLPTPLENQGPLLLEIGVEYQRAVALGLHLGILRPIEYQQGQQKEAKDIFSATVILSTERGNESVMTGIVPATQDELQSGLGEYLPLHHLKQTQGLWLAYLQTLRERMKEQRHIDYLREEAARPLQSFQLIRGVIKSSHIIHTPQDFEQLQQELVALQKELIEIQEALQISLQLTNDMDLTLCCYLIGLINGLELSSNKLKKIKQSAQVQLAHDSQPDFFKACSEQHLWLVQVPFDEEWIRGERQQLTQHRDRLLENKEFMAEDEQCLFQHLTCKIKLMVAWLDTMTDCMEQGIVKSLTPLESWRIRLSAGLYQALTDWSWEQAKERLTAVETASRARARLTVEMEENPSSSLRPC